MDIVQPASQSPTDIDLARWREASPLLDFKHPAVGGLVMQRGWLQLGEHARIGAV
jgi:hypothetical protein